MNYIWVLRLKYIYLYNGDKGIAFTFMNNSPDIITNNRRDI